MEHIDLRNLDKSNWKSFRFDQIAKNISERVDPNNTHLETYVGLEHIDSENIHITRSGTPDDVDGQKLRFYKGDIIFGRRRAYQRKAAIAECDGFCSAHALVLRANPDVIDSMLFPFFLHSDSFMHRAIDISVGSLSPTINWGTLKNQEFLLPPKPQQAKITELLWAMDEVIEKEKESTMKYKTFFNRFLFDSLSGRLSENPETWYEYTFGDLGESYGGLTGKSKNDFGKGAPYVTYINIYKNTKVDINQIDYVIVNEGEKQNEVKYGDILLTGSSETPEEVGMSSVVLDSIKGYYLNSFCFGFRLHDFKTLLPEYARYLMRGKEVRLFMYNHAQGSTRFNLSKTTVKNKLKISLPKIEEQKKIASKLEEMEELLNTYETMIGRSKSLQKSLINQIF